MTKKVRVIDSLWTFTIAVAVLGPFALPLLWRNPRFRVRTKIMGSLFVLALTYALYRLSVGIFSSLSQQIDQMNETLRQTSHP